MGGCIDWAALPLLAEIHGVQDIEQAVALLIVLRDNQQPTDTAWPSPP